MIEKKVLVTLKNGFHIRPATKLVKKAKKFCSEISIKLNNKEVDAKSLLQIQTLGISKNDLIYIKANGKDELKAVNELTKIINLLE